MRAWLAVALVACGRGGPSPEQPLPVVEPAPTPVVVAPKTLRFVPVEPVPELATMKTPIATTRAFVGGVEVPIDFHVLYRAGEGDYGLVRRLGGTEPVGPPCTEQDSNSLLVAGGRPWLVSHFECPPGAVNVTELSKGPQGELVPVATKPVSFDAWGGVWNPCAGMVSPWGTHIGSEEYEPDAASWNPATGRLDPDAYNAWADMVKVYADPKQATPYRYGYATEVAVADDGAATGTKHPAMGRFSHEVSYVLPDGRTVYQSDDGPSTGFFLFVADRAGDLSAGVLYAAALAQQGEATPASDDDALAITWISLGHATDPAIARLVEARVTFADLFEREEPGAGGTCAEGFTYSRHMYGRECLKLRPPSTAVPDPAQAASRLETRRYAAMLGGVAELEKGEGLAFDAETGRVFLALSSQSGPMVAEPDEPVDRIRWPNNPCGAVFAADTAAGVVDRAGAAIDSAHVAVTLRPEVVGAPLAEPDAAGNRCSPGAIANPDNVTFLSGYGLLVIAEDTRAHANAVLWSWDVRTRELVPVMMAPPGGEFTGIQWIPDLLGHAYLTTVVQHPWGVRNPPPGITPADQRAFTGYLGPFPALR